MTTSYMFIITGKERVNTSQSNTVVPNLRDSSRREFGLFRGSWDCHFKIFKQFVEDF